ncbi:KLTH0C08624p [Lachancea thermotolerans CBS 6340]|uniref:KLTH0C08624p n=1 Tax=Lachancea thermotolerans (strain ATCC 56472 / CBS 6340 / NRRL Y-8284) TaxID=559295 RepID=C5DEE9_LACTC|nr:KLTH0C08624p [Lachancea thermotolerans CBS 6340]CAR22160.1 KLTH0C08624p [Lachancea thermotolerans CBS 6340]
MCPIKKIAVIGGGPAGLIAANDLFKESERQRWEVVGFETRNCLGGVWSDKPGSGIDSPQVFEELRKLPHNLGTSYSPEDIFQYGSPLVSNGRIASLRPFNGTSVTKPLRLVHKHLPRDGLINSSKTGVYDGLMTNVPGELMAFGPENLNTYASRNADISPLVTLDQVQMNFEKFIEESEGSKTFRKNTCIEYLDKISPDKWVIVARRHPPGSEQDEWYMELFDAVVIANGHFTCPYVPFYMSNLTGVESGIHEFNTQFPNVLSHVRDLDLWYNKRFPQLKEEVLLDKRRVVIVGKSFSAMDVLKRLVPILDKAQGNLEIILSSNTPPMPENTANPFYWFDEWLSKTSKVEVKGPIAKFVSSHDMPALQFQDGSIFDNISDVIFATGYLYTFPFISKRLLESYRVLITPDSRNFDAAPSNVSRVTGLYLHTFSIADPTMGFVGVSSNANFQSFNISSQALTGVWSRFNNLFNEEAPQDGPIFNSIWSKVLPSVQEQLKWSQNRLLKTGNNGAFHFYYPLPALKEEWLDYCKPLFRENHRNTMLFPDNSADLSEKGIQTLKARFFDTMGPEHL